MQVLTVWDVQVWDGGGRHNHAFYVKDEFQANVWKEKNTYDSIVKKEIQIFDTIAEYQEFKNGELKRKALQKLTREERVALGFPAEV